MWWEEIITEEVRHWMEQKSKGNCTPNLKKFGFGMYNSASEQWTEMHHGMLMDICLEEGLQFWSTRQLHAEDWDLMDHPERTQCKIMEVGGYEYPKGELASRARCLLENHITSQNFYRDVLGYMSGVTTCDRDST